MENKNITIVISTAFQDAGDATRAIEIAKGLKKYQPKEYHARIIFISHGSQFEQKVIEQGFEVCHAEPKLPGVGLYQDLGMTVTNLIGSEKLAKELLFGEIEAYKKIRPNFVLHGFWPIASLARRMMEREIPGICFLPLPLVPGILDAIPDVPEQLKILSFFPKAIRLWLFRHIPRFIKERVPLLRQNNIRHAAYQLGWKGEKLVNTFDLLKSNLTIVNDLPEFYRKEKFPSHVFFSGPLFSTPEHQDEVAPEILKVFDPKNKKVKVFCTLSSSGSEELLTEVIKVFREGQGLDWNAVILSPHFSVSEAKKILGNREGVYITDKFVPALKVNSMADFVVSHGGQGTIQTAIYSGTPIVGVAAQQEQFINLSNIESFGAGIRIPYSKWKAHLIQKSIAELVVNKEYTKSMLKLKESLVSIDGVKNASLTIWQKIGALKVL